MSSWDRVRLQGPNARRALLGGVVATLVLTGLMYLGHAVGVDIWNIPAMIASAMGFGRYISPADPLWMWGVVVYAIFGVLVLPLCYAYWVYSYLPGPVWFRGLLWGAFLWFLEQMLVMPLIGEGVFDRRGPDPAIEIVSQLVLWLVYGVLLGIIAGPQEVWAQRQHREQHV